MATTTNDDKLKMLGVAAIGAGIGMMIGAALTGVDRRAAFARQVSERLAESQVQLLGSDLGRDASRLVWILSIRLPQGSLLTVHAPVVGDAFAPRAADAIAAAVLNYLNRHRLLAA